MDSSSINPIPRRSSETKATPSFKVSLVLVTSMAFPWILTVPLDGYKPMIPFAILIFPCPAKPPIPKISPSFTLKETSLATSPGILTLKCSNSKHTFCPSFFFSSVMSRFKISTLRPTINSDILMVLSSLVS